MVSHWYYKLIADKFKPVRAQCLLYYYHWGNFPAFLVLNVFRLIFLLYRFVFWRLNGIQNHLNDTYRGRNYEASAQIFKIVAKCKASPFDKVRSCFFLTQHQRFDKPECVLANDVILAEITRTKAVFVQLDKNIDFYGVEKAPFLFITLVKNAIRLIELPLCSFEKLADSLQEPTSYYDSITFLFSSGRCGSTAIARIIKEADPECLVLSEPPILMDFVSFKRSYPASFYDPALRNSLKLLLKPMCNKKRLFIKPTYFTCNIAEDVQQVVPGAKFIYCHRDPFQYVLAQVRAFGSSPLYKILQTVVALKIWDCGETYVGFHRNARVEAAVLNNLHGTLFELCCIVWADNFWRYKEQAAKFPFPSLYYDDLLIDPVAFCEQIFQLIDLPASSSKNGRASNDGLMMMNKINKQANNNDQKKFLQDAMKALSEDAQKETCLSQKTLQDVPRINLDPLMKKRVDKFCRELDLPLFNWNESFNVEEADGAHNLRNGYYRPNIANCNEIKKQLNQWQPDNETFKFMKFGNRTLLMHLDKSTNKLIPFRVPKKAA